MQDERPRVDISKIRPIGAFFTIGGLALVAVVTLAFAGVLDIPKEFGVVLLILGAMFLVLGLGVLLLLRKMKNEMEEAQDEDNDR